MSVCVFECLCAFVYAHACSRVLVHVRVCPCMVACVRACFSQSLHSPTGSSIFKTSRRAMPPSETMAPPAPITKPSHGSASAQNAATTHAHQTVT